VPARNQTAPDSLAGRIIEWLREHPGAHSAQAVAAGIGADDTGQQRTETRGVGRYKPITSELSRMVRRGALVKYRPPGAAPRGPGSVYAIPPEE
jgi:hypothetical protein